MLEIQEANARNHYLSRDKRVTKRLVVGSIEKNLIGKDIKAEKGRNPEGDCA